jgi:deazaflavin-dependent oxidoreductase (nitroreductase family)
MSEMSDFNQSIIEEFRANGGKVGGPFAGATVVLLTTTGKKSGQSRVTPLACQSQGDGTIYIFGSFAGGPKNPDWYYNLLAHPEVGIEIGEEKYTATATPITGAERDLVFARQKELMPVFAEYEKKAERVIPVIALTRTA